MKMSIEVRAEIVFAGGMRFDGRSDRSRTTIAVDFAKEGEPIAGFTPLELLLTSLCGCSGQVVVGLLQRMGQNVRGLTVRARGTKRAVRHADRNICQGRLLGPDREIPQEVEGAGGFMMSIEVKTETVFQGGMLFRGTSDRSGRTVDVDFTPEGEPIDGFTPLELLLTSLCGCSGQVVVGLLKRMGQDVRDLTVRARGTKREVHPKVLVAVELLFEFRGGKVEGASVAKAFALSEDRYCPVWVMLRANVPITAKYEIVAG
jgi:putative redox protein